MSFKKFGIWGNTDKEIFWKILPEILSWAEKNKIKPFISKRQLDQFTRTREDAECSSAKLALHSIDMSGDLSIYPCFCTLHTDAHVQISYIHVCALTWTMM